MSRAYNGDDDGFRRPPPPDPNPLPVPQPNPLWPGPRHAAAHDAYPAHALGTGAGYQPRHAAGEER